ncbi:peroxidase [Manduca sexta]|uniref:peroxidase n=1 Tax=Manduca sexta TaxID=7130 RepID=UPI00188EBE51|nr:peroxidase [Manduca sexta]
MWCLLVLLPLVSGQQLYDAFSGKPITEDRRNELDALNLTTPCTINVAPCKHDEGRRVDGTCTNPKYPSLGAVPTRLLRMRPARYGLGNALRPATNGSMLPSARLLRTKILTDGYQEDHNFSFLISSILVFGVTDIADLLVLLSYSIVSDCCLGNTPNRLNPNCIAIPVPQDDPYLRRTGVRCMNLTRFPTFQELQCAPNSLPAERYVKLSTPLIDLSTIYGSTSERERQIRAYEGGLLKSEMRNGLEYPPGTAPICVNNRRPIENSCYEFGDSYGGNLISGVYLTAIWFFREHNRLARRLAEINPCWGDQKLFETARQINIAQWQYILYYEATAAVLGRENALEAGIIYDTDGYVNDFDPRYKPGTYHEYIVGIRWFHTLQDERNDLYSRDGTYLGSRTGVDDEFRSGILEVNNTEADLTQGTFRQRAAKVDYNIDPDLTERLFGELQNAADLPAIDMMRGRDEGLAPYHEYRKLCGLPHAHKFSDLEDTIYPDKLEQMRRIYDGEIDDVELMVAIYSERLIKGGWVGPTLFCIMARNMIEWRKSDRFFFEHGDIPAALTLPQLREVRSTSTARIICDNGDRVDKIQPHAMYNIGKGNELAPCETIPGIDLAKWADPHCHGEDHEEEPNSFKDNDYWANYYYKK